MLVAVQFDSPAFDSADLHENGMILSTVPALSSQALVTPLKAT